MVVQWALKPRSAPSLEVWSTKFGYHLRGRHNVVPEHKCLPRIPRLQLIVTILDSSSSSAMNLRDRKAAEPYGKSATEWEELQKSLGELQVRRELSKCRLLGCFVRRFVAWDVVVSWHPAYGERKDLQRILTPEATQPRKHESPREVHRFLDQIDLNDRRSSSVRSAHCPRSGAPIVSPLPHFGPYSLLSQPLQRHSRHFLLAQRLKNTQATLETQ